MGNYFISVSNGLLEGDHRKRIGAAIWEYLWCLDKVTKIDKEGWGTVLGGKPVNLGDFGSAHNTTVSHNLNKLARQGYITLRRTPYGIVIKVAKMKKRFSEIAKPSGISDNTKTRIQKTLNPPPKNAKSRPKNAKSNKTITVDNNSKTIGSGDAHASPTPRDKAKAFFQGVASLVQGGEVPWLQDSLRTIAERNKIPKRAVWDHVRDFAAYWTERNGTGTKERWELQKTFEVERRLATWFRRAGMKEYQTTRFSEGEKVIKGLDDIDV